MSDSNILAPASLSLVSRLIDSRQTRRVSSRQQSEHTVLLNRRRTLFRKIDKLQTKLLKLNNEMSDLNAEVATAYNRFSIASDQLHRLRQSVILETTRINEQEIQSNAGNEYARSRRLYDEYRNANPNDRNGIISRHDDYSRIHNAIIANSQERARPLIVERDMAQQTFNETKRNYDNLYERQTNLTQQIYNLEPKLDRLLIQDRELNQARGKRQHYTRHKKGKQRHIIN